MPEAFTQLGMPARFAVAFVIVLALIVITAWVIKRISGAGVAGHWSKGREHRIEVLDAAAVDPKRRLVLIRRDDKEHLLLIGGANDVVVETGIASTNPAEEPAEADEASAIGEKDLVAVSDLETVDSDPVPQTPETEDRKPLAAAASVAAPVAALATGALATHAPAEEPQISVDAKAAAELPIGLAAEEPGLDFSGVEEELAAALSADFSKDEAADISDEIAEIVDLAPSPVASPLPEPEPETASVTAALPLSESIGDTGQVDVETDILSELSSLQTPADEAPTEDLESQDQSAADIEVEDEIAVEPEDLSELTVGAPDAASADPIIDDSQIAEAATVEGQEEIGGVQELSETQDLTAVEDETSANEPEAVSEENEIEPISTIPEGIDPVFYAMSQRLNEALKPIRPRQNGAA